MKQICLGLFLLLKLTSTFSQTNIADNYLAWSSTRRLSVEDFGIKKKDLQTNPSFAQFNIQFEIGGFDFLTKNFNKKVHNYFIKSASWIDTSQSINFSITYQQTLFDICEIYTRQLRRDIKKNRRKIAGGNKFIMELNAKAMTNFANRRLEYDNETQFGADIEKQAEWEKRILEELTALKEYSVDN